MTHKKLKYISWTILLDQNSANSKVKSIPVKCYFWCHYFVLQTTGHKSSFILDCYSSMIFKCPNFKINDFNLFHNINLICQQPITAGDGYQGLGFCSTEPVNWKKNWWDIGISFHIISPRESGPMQSYGCSRQSYV